MTVFYRKYRPQKLADVIDQEHVKKTLLGQLESGRISHGYLFAGPKGTGKTSTARIFAKAVNCQSRQLTKRDQMSNVKGSPREAGQVFFGEPCGKCQSCLAIKDGSYLDLIEIDAASNRGIDEIRDLREKIKLSPLAGRFKVYIIDEAHMLTTEAFNALLKTLEEPPSHAIFILCTTDAGKLPATIISRLQRFNFSRATKDDLISAIEKIVKSESIKIEREAISAIAEASDGSYRDAISILDQVASLDKTIQPADVSEVALLFDWNHLFEFVENLASYNLRKAAEVVDKLAEAGTDIPFFTRELILFLKKLLFCKIGIQERDGGDATQIKMARELAQRFEYNDLVTLMKLFLIAESEIKLYPLAQIPLILAVCKYLPAVQLPSGSEPQVFDSDHSASRSGSEDPSGSRTTSSWPRGVAQTRGGRRPAGQGRQVAESVARVQIGVDEIENNGDTGEAKGAPPRLKSLEDQEGYAGQARSSKKTISHREEKTTNGSKKPANLLAQIEQGWGEFLNKVKGQNVHVVALLRSTKVLAFDGTDLTLEVFYRFHKDKLEEQKIRVMLEGILSEIVGKIIRLKFVLAQKESKPTRQVELSDVVEPPSEELAKIAQEIFSK